MGRFQNNRSMGWLHPKSTRAHPLAWANKKTYTQKHVTLSIQPTFDSLTPYTCSEGVPTCLCRTEPIIHLWDSAKKLGDWKLSMYSNVNKINK